MTIFPLSGPTPARRGAGEGAVAVGEGATDTAAAARWAALEAGFTPPAAPPPQPLDQRPPAFQTIRKLFYAQLFGLENGQEIMARGYVDTQRLADAYREKLAVVSALTGRIFRAEGISLSPPIAIAVGAEGRLRVDPGHPDAARIDEALAQAPGLRGDLIALSALGGQLRGAEDGSAFAAAYERDQATALDSYAHLLANAAPDFVALVDASGVTAQFRWPDGRVGDWAPQGLD